MTIEQSVLSSVSEPSVEMFVWLLSILWTKCFKALGFEFPFIVGIGYSSILGILSVYGGI